MKKSVLFKVALLIAMCIPLDGMAAVYRLTLLDTTGSMTEGTKWEDAKAVAEQILVPNPGGWDALWQIRGGESGLVPGYDFTRTVFNPETGEFEPNAVQNILDKINSGDLDPVTGPTTPLADSLCNAMTALENVAPAEGNDKHLFLITDGDENTSGVFENLISECSTDIEFNINGLPFKVLATDVYPSQRVSEDGDPDRDWIEPLTIIPNVYDEENDRDFTGRVYHPPGDVDMYDWSAGVIRGSWEWRMYYRVARTNIPSEPENSGWPLSAEDSPSDVIFNIVSFYKDVTPTARGVALSTTARVTGTTSEYLPPEMITRARSLPASGGALMGDSYNQGQLDAFTFSGLAQLSGGKYIPVVEGEPLPTIGDLNEDGIVDETDMRIVLAWFGRPVDTYNQPSIDADLFGDSFINNADMQIVRNNWTDFEKYPPIVGDTDYNWCVDQADLNKIWQWYGITPGEEDQAFYYADLNADGLVDEEDLDLYYAHEGEGCGSNGIPSCNDGIKYGEETDIDCGGSVCGGCESGQNCVINDDCLSNVCDEGVCIGGGAHSDTEASVNIYQDWGTGYCANIGVTNNASGTTTSWTVNLNMNGGTISSSWSGIFTGNVTVRNVSWNAAILAGQTIASAGFCANRGGGGTAEVVSASATY